MLTLIERRTERLKNLSKISWDVVVIGGGATGAGVALDASQRGFKTMLVEKGDFAGATSSASTKLIHGGVRYLEKAVKEFDPGQLSLVFEALHERSTMLKLAPHLTEVQPIIIPCYSLAELAYFKAGTFFYDKLAPSDTGFPKSRILTKEQVLTLIPELKSDQLAGGVLYVDGQFDDAAYNLALIRSAESFGAETMNYLSCVDFVKDEDGCIHNIRVQDEISGEIAFFGTRFTINCTGPFSDDLRKKAKNDVSERLRPSQGIHLVFEQDLLGGTTGFLIPKTEDGRLIFALPWYESVIVGTTEREVHQTEYYHEVKEEDINYILENLRRYLAKPIHESDIKSVLAGVRPLVAAERSKTSELIRNHEVEVFPQERFMSVLGGKWTTYRKMAEDAVDELCKQLSIQRACLTAQTPLFNAISFYEYESLIQGFDLTHQQKSYLYRYGNQILNVLSFCNSNRPEPVHPDYPFIWEEVDYALRYQHAIFPDDILARRMRVKFVSQNLAKQMLPRVMERIATYHNLTEQAKKELQAAYS